MLEYLAIGKLTNHDATHIKVYYTFFDDYEHADMWEDAVYWLNTQVLHFEENYCTPEKVELSLFSYQKYSPDSPAEELYVLIRKEAVGA